MSLDELTDSFRDSIATIADDFFTAMITGESGSVALVPAGTHAMGTPIHAWVDMAGTSRARALLTTESSTADLIARALLDTPSTQDVSEEDLRDAFGETANVIGGNIKSLLPDQGRLMLPQVAGRAPAVDAPADLVVELDWAGRGLLVSLWRLADPRDVPVPITHSTKD